MLTRVWQELEYRIDVCRVTVVHTSNISSCQKKKNFFSFPVAVKNSIKVGPFGFLVFLKRDLLYREISEIHKVTKLFP